VFPVFVVAFRGEAAKTRESGVEFFLCVQGFFVSTDCTMPTGVRESADDEEEEEEEEEVVVVVVVVVVEEEEEAVVVAL
jgi:hypothetical protein